MRKKVPLGLMPPLSGLVALYGPEISWAGKIACEEINSNGGVLGRPLELIIEDDGSLPETAVPAANKLIDEHGCVAIIGNLLSNSRISVASRVAEPRKIPYLNFSFYEGSISSRYFFHFAALPNQQIDKMIPYMAKKFGPKMFFAGNNYEWPRGSIDAAKRALIKMGGEVVGEEYFPIGTDNFSSLMEQVSHSGADVFVPYAAGNDQLCLLTQFTNSGLKSKMAVVMGHYDEAMVASISPEIREGFYSSNTYFMNVDSEENRRYLDKLSRLPDVNGILPKGNGVLTNFGEGTYLCVHAFAKAANLAGSLNSEDIVNALEEIEVTGPQGIVTMDPATHHAHVNTYLSRCMANGQFEVIEKFGVHAPIIPERYLEHIPSDSSSSTDDRRNRATDKNKMETHSEFVAVIDYPYRDDRWASSISLTQKIENGEMAILSLRTLFASQETVLDQAVSEKRMIALSEPVELSLGLFYLISVSPLYKEGKCGQLAIYKKKCTPPQTELSSSIIPYEKFQRKGSRKSIESSIVLLTDAQLLIEYMNETACQVWGVKSASSVKGKHVSTLFPSVENLTSMLSNLSGESSNSFQHNIESASGKTCLVELTVEVRNNDAEDELAGILISGKRLPTLHSLSRRSDSHEIFYRADIGIIATDERGVILQANHAANKIFGYPPGELHGLSVHFLLPPHMRRRHEHFLRHFLEDERSERVMGKRGNVSGYRKDGSFFPAEASLSKFSSDNGTTLIVTLRDITDRKRAQEHLLWQATHDPLTHLPNRNLIQERLENALERSKKSSQLVALMFIDLDEFKFINDSYGHKVGDQLLVAIAERLVDVVRPGDTVARFGGDEFLVLCDQLDKQESVPMLADRILLSFKQPFEIHSLTFYPTASIGLAIGYGDTENKDSLLRNADAAMYEVKQKGRDGWRVFSKEMGEKSRRYLDIANGLRGAIDKHELEVFFQPIVDIRSQKVVGAEALIRWAFNGELVSPAVFIPISEVTGSILEIGKWVFEQACVQQVKWKMSVGKDSPYVSINLSARQIVKPELIEDIIGIVKKTGVSPEDVLIEITETTLMSDIEVSQVVLQALGDLGFSLAIDDFGTGHSSLSRIKNMPIAMIKIDKEFVDEIETDQGSQAIISSVVSLGKGMAVRITAEGVESVEQFDLLGKLGCNNAQGYLFSQPVPQQMFMDNLIQSGARYDLSTTGGSKTYL
ncbi:ABC transporter substrate-binding protein [Pseudomonadota bacterium]